MKKNNAKTKDIYTYVILAFFLGFVGAHKFYIGKTIHASIMLGLSLIACITGTWFFFHVALLWAIIDGIVGLGNFSNPKKIFQQTKQEKEANEKYNKWMLNFFATALEKTPNFFHELFGEIISILVGGFILVYLGVTFGFPYFFNCPKDDTACRCLVSSVNKNMSFSDKITFIVNGANREDLLPYLNFGDAIKCALVSD